MTKQRLSPSNRTYIEEFLKKVEEARTRPFPEEAIERLLAEMQSEDPITRANAVREICPCRMPWEVFNRLRKAAKRLQKDPDPTVRANALHVEEDARMVASMEGEIERKREFEDERRYHDSDRNRNRRRQRFNQ
jgi:hypothetical protein